MKVEVTDVAPCRKKLSVEVPAEKVDEVYEETYSFLQSNVQVKGFRKGHAPKRVLQRKFKDEVSKDVRGKLFQQSYEEALKENDLSPMGDPDLDVETLTAEPGQSFSFETEVDVRPKFDLPEYKGLKLTETVEVISDESVDEQLKNMRHSFAQHESVEDKSQADDMLEVDVVAMVEEEELLNEKAQRVRIDGERLFGIECKDLVEKLTGLAKGDETALELALPDDFYKEEMRGKTTKIQLTVTDVLRAELPEMDDAFAKNLGMDSMDKLRDTIRRNIRTEREREARQTLEQDAAGELIDACSFDLPEEFMKRQTEAALIRSKMQMARMGATKEYMDEQAEEIEKSSKEETERTVRRTIIFDAIADKEEIEVSEEEIWGQIQMLARSYNITPEKMLKRVQDNNGLMAIASELRDIKVTKVILDAAEITREGEPKEEDAAE